MTPEELAELISNMFQNTCDENGTIDDVTKILKFWEKYNQIKNLPLNIKLERETEI